MSNISKQLLRDYVNENKFNSVNEVLQETLEAEMDTVLGYPKYDVSDKQTANSRNGHSKKTIKTEMGEIELNIPRDRCGEFQPQIIPKYQRHPLS